VTLVKAEKLAKFPDSQEACNGLSLLACRRAYWQCDCSGSASSWWSFWTKSMTTALCLLWK